jgi:hypothetical protein
VRGRAKASGRKAFFFEKKKQKTFVHFGFGLAGESEAHVAKVFCFFFSKKKFFSTLPTTSEEHQPA